jgi:hypothetical protein
VDHQRDVGGAGGLGGARDGGEVEALADDVGDDALDAALGADADGGDAAAERSRWRGSR